jgi:hypothetical protein
MFGQDATNTKRVPGSGVLDSSSDVVRDVDNHLTILQMANADHWYPLTFDISKAWGATHVANEFRPVNMAILYCIKHD